MAYLTEEMSKMTKLVKKLKKSKEHSKKRARLGCAFRRIPAEFRRNAAKGTGRNGM
jgi:hypothetical protein